MKCGVTIFVTRAVAPGNYRGIAGKKARRVQSPFVDIKCGVWN